MEVVTLKPTNPPHRNLIMPSVVFAFGDSSKEVDLKDINSVEDVASNMKEVIKTESKEDSND
tara:strand:- start:72 stop:257 length:186 start_codon:yes stop_codon:yes gene_type:complete